MSAETTPPQSPTKHYLSLAGYVLLLIACIWAIVVGVTRFTQALPTLGNAAASPFTALFAGSGTSTSATTTGVNLYPTATSTATSTNPIVTYQQPYGTSTLPSSTGTVPLAQNGATAVSYPSAHYTQGRDLSVHMLSYSQTGARFLILNIGNTPVSGGWTFTAQIPGGEAYTSPLQPALASGQGYIYTLAWRAPAYQSTYYAQPQYYTSPSYYSYQQNCSIAPARYPYYGAPFGVGQSYTNCQPLTGGAIVPSGYSAPTYSYQTAPLTQQMPSYYYPQTSPVFSVTVDPSNMTGDVNRTNNYGNASTYF